jgi:hypothetical protein
MAANKQQTWSVPLDDGSTIEHTGFVFGVYGICRVINEFGEETSRWQVDHIPSGKRVLPNSSPALASCTLGWNKARRLASRLARDPAWQFIDPPQTPEEKAQLKSSLLDHLQALSLI